MPGSGRTSGHVADILRERICVAHPEASETLHEGRLAIEFGVSRTPIRQALQHLAYEGLVTVRSGVGTVVIPLAADGKSGDIKVACALLTAAANCVDDGPVPQSVTTDLSGFLGVVSMLNRPDRTVVFEVRARLLETFSGMIESGILQAAYRASHWRMIRWRMNDLRNAPETEHRRLKSMLQDLLTMAKGDKITDLLHEASRLDQNDLTRDHGARART